MSNYWFEDHIHSTILHLVTAETPFSKFLPPIQYWHYSVCSVMADISWNVAMYGCQWCEWLRWPPWTWIKYLKKPISLIITNSIFPIAQPLPPITAADELSIIVLVCKVLLMPWKQLMCCPLITYQKFYWVITAPCEFDHDMLFSQKIPSQDLKTRRGEYSNAYPMVHKFNDIVAKACANSNLLTMQKSYH